MLWGRLYCGRICAFGALTQLMDAVVPAQAARRAAAVDRAARRATIKYGLLAGVVALLPRHRDTSIYRYVEPFWMFGLSRHDGAVDRARRCCSSATVFVRNLYCRFLCPVGAALGLLSNLTVFRIKRWSECKTLQDLREDLRVGRDSRTEDHQDASASAATTASGSTWTRRSARTGSSSSGGRQDKSRRYGASVGGASRT